MEINENMSTTEKSRNIVVSDSDFFSLQRQLVDLNADGQYQTSPIEEE